MPELFANYEITRASLWWPRLARYVIGSAVMHALVLGPILYIPTVRSMLNIVNLFRDADYAYEDYARTSIGRRADVILDADGRFRYPPGYFQIFKQASAPKTAADPVSPKASPTPAVARLKPRPTARPRVSPSPKAIATPSVTPSPEIAASSSKGETPAATTTPTATETATLNQETEEALNKQAEAAKIKRPPKINTKPFVDLLAEAKRLKTKGELNLDGTLNMTVSATRNDNGTLKDVEIVNGGSSNPVLERLAEELIQALSASKALVFLEGASQLRLTLHVNETRLSARITTDMDTPERASEMALGYSGMLFLDRMRRAGRPEVAVYDGTKISANGKQVVVSFQMSRKAAGDLLSKQLPSS